MSEGSRAVAGWIGIFLVLVGAFTIHPGMGLAAIGLICVFRASQ